jgi:AcrR family transcriptional regulator
VRADAMRNRAKVLEAAVVALKQEGLSVPVAEIARRAGVGTGTVSRHFPTKESLYEAIVLSRVEELVEHAGQLSKTYDPGTAFFQFLAFKVEQGAQNRALAEAISGAGFDIEAAASRNGHDLAGMERRLLARAQRAGAVRRDVTLADIKALVIGCLAREHRASDPKARQRMIRIVSVGLQR